MFKFIKKLFSSTKKVKETSTIDDKQAKTLDFSINNYINSLDYTTKQGLIEFYSKRISEQFSYFESETDIVNMQLIQEKIRVYRSIIAMYKSNK